MDTTGLKRSLEGFKPGYEAVVRDVLPRHSTGRGTSAHSAVEVRRATVHFVRHGQGVHNLDCEHEETLCKSCRPGRAYAYASSKVLSRDTLLPWKPCPPAACPPPPPPRSFLPTDESPKYFDAELTETGVGQAARVGELLRRHGRVLQVALVSPLTRTLCVPTLGLDLILPGLLRGSSEMRRAVGQGTRRRCFSWCWHPAHPCHVMLCCLFWGFF